MQPRQGVQFDLEQTQCIAARSRRNLHRNVPEPEARTGTSRASPEPAPERPNLSPERSMEKNETFHQRCTISLTKVPPSLLALSYSSSKPPTCHYNFHQNLLKDLLLEPLKKFSTKLLTGTGASERARNYSIRPRPRTEPPSLPELDRNPRWNHTKSETSSHAHRKFPEPETKAKPAPEAPGTRARPSRNRNFPTRTRTALPLGTRTALEAAPTLI